MNELLPLCEAQTSLSESERAFLENLAEGAYEIDAEPRCELEADHEGIHAAMGQSCGTEEQDWWVIWAPGNGVLWHPRSETLLPRIQSFAPCAAAGASDEEADECALPLTHRGAHSFEIEPCDGRQPSLLVRRRLAAALREQLDPERRAFLDSLDSQLASEGHAMPLLTPAEALVAMFLLQQAGAADVLFEDMAHTLSTRLEERLEDQLGDAGVTQLMAQVGC